MTPLEPPHDPEAIRVEAIEPATPRPHHHPLDHGGHDRMTPIHAEPVPGGAERPRSPGEHAGGPGARARREVPARILGDLAPDERVAHVRSIPWDAASVRRIRARDMRDHGLDPVTASDQDVVRWLNQTEAC